MNYLAPVYKTSFYMLLAVFGDREALLSVLTNRGEEAMVDKKVLVVDFSKKDSTTTNTSTSSTIPLAEKRQSQMCSSDVASLFIELREKQKKAEDAEILRQRKSSKKIEDSRGEIGTDVKDKNESVEVEIIKPKNLAYRTSVNEEPIVIDDKDSSTNFDTPGKADKDLQTEYRKAKIKQLYDSSHFAFDFASAEIELTTANDLYAFRGVVKMCGATFMGNFGVRYSSAYAVVHTLLLVMCVVTLTATVQIDSTIPVKQNSANSTGTSGISNSSTTPVGTSTSSNNMSLLSANKENAFLKNHIPKEFWPLHHLGIHWPMIIETIYIFVFCTLATALSVKNGVEVNAKRDRVLRLITEAVARYDEKYFGRFVKREKRRKVKRENNSIETDQFKKTNTKSADNVNTAPKNIDNNTAVENNSLSAESNFIDSDRKPSLKAAVQKSQLAFHVSQQFQEAVKMGNMEADPISNANWTDQMRKMSKESLPARRTENYDHENYDFENDSNGFHDDYDAEAAAREASARERFHEAAQVVKDDLEAYFLINPIRFIYLDCTAELFGVVYAFLSFLVGLVVSVFYTRGLLRF